MPSHVVKQGEHASRIAQEAGLGGFALVWDHPENAEVRETRRNPHVLLARDQLFVPDIAPRTEGGATDARHRFRAQWSPLTLRVRLLGVHDQELGDVPCELRLGGDPQRTNTDDQGVVEEQIDPSLEDCRFQMTEAPDSLQECFQLRVGHLDPVGEEPGQRARLVNLGYMIERDDDENDARFALAMQEFQCEHGLTVDGICGPKTQDGLVEAHGC